jgi:hypothetical protein
VQVGDRRNTPLTVDLRYVPRVRCPRYHLGDSHLYRAGLAQSCPEWRERLRVQDSHPGDLRGLWRLKCALRQWRRRLRRLGRWGGAATAHPL